MIKKIESLADLRKKKDELTFHNKSYHSKNIVRVKIAMATCGIASGAKEVMDYFIEELEKRGIEAQVTKTGCMGYCYAEPTIEVMLPYQNPVIFGFVTIKKANDVIEKYIKNNELLDGIIPVNYEKISNY